MRTFKCAKCFVYLFSFIHATFLEISIIVTTLQGKLWFRGTKQQAQLQDPWDSHWCLFLVMLAPFRAHRGTFAFRGFPLWYSEPLWAWPLLTRSLHSSYPLWVMSTSQRPRRKSTPGQSPGPLVSQLPSQPLVPQSQAQKQGVSPNPGRQKKKRRGLMTSSLKILGQFKAIKDAVKRLKYFFLHPRML